MSAALTHVAVGLLLGLALRIPARYLAVAAFLAFLPDLDHLNRFFPVPFLETRVTFHNILFCVALPLAVYTVTVLRGASKDIQRLAGAAPVIMTSHLLLDILPLDIGSAKVALLYPFSREMYTASALRAFAADPTAFSTLTLVVLLLALISGVTLLLLHAAEHAPAKWRPRAFAAFGVAWLALFPAMLASGFVLAAPAHAEAVFAMEQPTIHMPEATLTALVYHLGGSYVPEGGIRMDVVTHGVTLTQIKNPALLGQGDRWIVAVDLPSLPVDLAAIEVRLVATADGHAYAEAAPRIVATHFEGPLSLATFDVDARGHGLLAIRNDGAARLPAGALVLDVRLAGAAAPLVNVTLPHMLRPGESWTVPFDAAGARGLLDISVRSRDDGYVYLRDIRSLPGS